jgi:hypothetical protein
MSHLVQRSDIIDYQTYGDTRDETRKIAMAAKKPRRVHLGGYLTMLFENRATLTYQIQEIMRAERIAREADIQTEIDTYNDMLGGPGDLGCVLLVEIDDVEERAVKLREWLGLQEHIYAQMADGSKVFASFDPSQVGEDRISAVQYLKFHVGEEAPVGFGTDFDALREEMLLSDDQRAALRADLDATHAG